MSQAAPAPADTPAAAAAADDPAPPPPGASSPSPPGSTTGATTAAATTAADAATTAAAAAPAPPQPPPERSSSFAAEAYAGNMADYDAEIREAEARKPFVADKEPWSALAREYERGAAAFGRKIAALGATYGALRRTRGDGNCFFRAVCFAQLEHLVQRCSASGGAADVARFAGVVKGWRGKLLAAGYQELVFEDALEALLGLLRLIDGSEAGGGDGFGFGASQQQQRLTLDGLVSYFRDDITSNTAVMLLRMVASAELLTRADFFAPFVAGAGGAGVDDDSVEAFCRRCVEPMGEESDNIQAVALTDAMQLPVRVVYLDSRDGGGGGGGGGGEGAASEAVTTHDFVPEACGADAKPVVHVLYRPGHYDICYPLLVAPAPPR